MPLQSPYVDADGSVQSLNSANNDSLNPERRPNAATSKSDESNLQMQPVPVTKRPPQKKKLAAKMQLSSRRKIKWNVEPYLTKMKKAIAVALSGRSTSKVAAQFGIPARTLRRYVANERVGIFPENGSGDDGGSPPNSGRSSPMATDVPHNMTMTPGNMRNNSGQREFVPHNQFEKLNGHNLFSPPFTMQNNHDAAASPKAVFLPATDASVFAQHLQNGFQMQQMKTPHAVLQPTQFQPGTNSLSQFSPNSSPNGGQLTSPPRNSNGQQSLTPTAYHPGPFQATSPKGRQRSDSQVSSFALLLQACQQRAPTNGLSPQQQSPYHTHHHQNGNFTQISQHMMQQTPHAGHCPNCNCHAHGHHGHSHGHGHHLTPHHLHSMVGPYQSPHQSPHHTPQHTPQQQHHNHTPKSEPLNKAPDMKQLGVSGGMGAVNQDMQV